ncbi:MAG: PAS domain S-box protein [Actinomycetota bacterium]|nr:PAS domain S-box protein [Actinomycetota bacterium]
MLESADLLAAIVADSDDVILSKDPDGTILSWNRGAQQLYGYSPDEVVGQNIAIIIPDELHGEEQDILQRVMRNERIRYLETQRLTKSGRRVDVRLTISPIRNMHGEVIGASTIGRDVTEEKRARQALLRAEQRFRAIFERSAQGIAITGVDGLILEANQALANILGFDSAEQLKAAGARASDFYTSPTVRSELLNILRSEGIVDGLEIELRRRDGREIWVSLNMVPISDSAGGMSGIQTLVTDVTVRRNMERQLSEAQKLESIGRLTGGIAHDFNNLLSVILNYIDFAVEADIDEKVRRDLLEARAASERATALVRQLLTFSRRDFVTPEVIDFNEIVNTTRRLLERTLGEDIELDVALDEELWRTEVSPVHAEQVLLNLAVNARDAMPTGGRLSIQTKNVIVDEAMVQQHPGLSPGPYVSVAVSDTGTGIEETVREEIFEPFVTTKPRELGTGLGLATVHGIVANAGGTIVVYSEPGLGSTFQIYLPATEAPLTADESEGDGAAASDGTETILIVDDEPAVARVAQRALEAAGFSVICAASPEDAEALAATHPVDLLLTDVVMPTISGHDLAARVQRLKPDVKVLLMSGYSEDLIARRGYFQVDHKLLMKPFTSGQLRIAAREALDEKDSRATGRWQERRGTVVVVDDDDDVRREVVALLEDAGFSVVGEFTDAVEGLNATRRLRPDFAIVDTMLPGTSGGLAVTALKTHLPNTRLIAISGTSLEKPIWADAIVDKKRINELSTALAELRFPLG